MTVNNAVPHMRASSPPGPALAKTVSRPSGPRSLPAAPFGRHPVRSRAPRESARPASRSIEASPRPCRTSSDSCGRGAYPSGYASIRLPREAHRHPIGERRNRYGRQYRYSIENLVADRIHLFVGVAGGSQSHRRRQYMILLESRGRPRRDCAASAETARKSPAAPAKARSAPPPGR